MSAPNFSFERRCILVTNEDYEFSNCPETGKPIGDNRSYPSAMLVDYEDMFNLVAIVLTSGYYADSCIDIIDREDRANELLDYTYHYSRVERNYLVDDVCYFLGVSKRFVLRHLKGCDCRHANYETELKKAFETMVEDARDIEVEKANKVLDNIKKAYGYKELSCDGVFSNGEAIYSVIR